MISEKYLDEFISDFCLKTGITIEQLKSKTRIRDIVEKRMIIAYFLRNKVGLTFMQVGNSLKKNHATIIHYIKLTERFKDIYPHIKRLYDTANQSYKLYETHLTLSYSMNIDAKEKETELKLVEILLEDNKKLKTKISKLENKLYDFTKLNK